MRAHEWGASVRYAVILALVAFGAVAAWTLSELDSRRTTSGGISSDGSSRVSWGSCPDDYFVLNPPESFDRSRVDCATIDVPAVYGRGSGLPDFRLAMMRVRATGDAEKLGTLFVNPGGPGGSGIEAIQYQPFPPAIHDSYDIVGFDPRGVLHSQPVSGEPIRCSDERDFASYWTLELSPENDAQMEELQRFAREFQSDCERRNPAWWTLGTPNVVRDLELMREQVTGEADLNFLGSSYGTTIAAEYIKAFPDRIGHIVLDSPTNSSPETAASMLAQARSINEHLLRLVDGYADARGLTRGAVVRLLLQIREWGDNDQLRGFAGLEPFREGSHARLSNDYMFNHGLFALTYQDTEQAQPSFNQAIDELLAYKWNGFFEQLALGMDGYDTELMILSYQDGEPYDPHGYTRDNSFEIMEMVNGIDQDLRVTRTQAQQAALDRKIKAAAPLLWSLTQDSSNFTYYDDHGGNQWSWAAFGDPDVPDPPKRTPPRTNLSGEPVLVIGSRDESTTPYPYAVRTAQDLESTLITWDGDEHAPLAGFQHACLNQIFVAYLVEDRLPDQPVTCSDTPPSPGAIHDRILAIIADAHSGKYFSNDFQDSYPSGAEVAIVRAAIRSSRGYPAITDALIACRLSHMLSHWSFTYLMTHPNSGEEVALRASVACDDY
jgi:pimeloyl-ACP methyl ester carboxylesterase